MRAWSYHRRVSAAIVVAASAGGCYGETDRSGDALPGHGAASVRIVSPADGATVSGRQVTVRLEASGVTIVPAGTDQPNTGHHHLFLDREATPVGATIPTGEGIVHLGAAQTEHVFTGLSPGDHTVIAVLGDFQHVRLETVGTDTVRFTVSER